MPLKTLYEILNEKAKKKNWEINPEAIPKEELPEKIMQFIKLSKISNNNRYEARIVLEFKNNIVECLYSVWERGKEKKEPIEGITKPEDIISFTFSQEKEIEKYIANLMDELDEKYLTVKFKRIRSKSNQAHSVP